MGSRESLARVGVAIHTSNFFCYFVVGETIHWSAKPLASPQQHTVQWKIKQN